jgi:hypothetical protein
MPKTGHDGDCSVFRSLVNRHPEDGICTCGYAHENNLSLYSDELRAALDYHNRRQAFLEDALRRVFSAKTPEEREQAKNDLRKA